MAGRTEPACSIPSNKRARVLSNDVSLPDWGPVMHDTLRRGCIVGLCHLLDLGVSANWTSVSGDTALMVVLVECAMSKRELCLRKLLESGADVRRRDTFGRTALTYAARKSDAESTRLLLMHGATAILHKRDIVGKTALDYAIMERSDQCALVLLEHGADMDCIGNAVMTPLMCAIDIQLAQTARWLLIRGVHVNAVRQRDGYTALEMVIESGPGRQWNKLSMVHLLLRFGANVNGQDRVGHDLLDRAARLPTFGQYQIDLFRLLVLDGAEINRRDSGGQPTALMTLMGRRENLMDIRAEDLLVLSAGRLSRRHRRRLLEEVEYYFADNLICAELYDSDDSILFGQPYELEQLNNGPQEDLHIDLDEAEDLQFREYSPSVTSAYSPTASEGSDSDSTVDRSI